ncbi:MAG: AAA domain-containing protein, partial [Pseudonocardiaceae bacterium]|nr:AAA domain-containing protein [Pseudonocardiaceae bacterium]
LPEAFTEGPLVSALREGSLLYIEELNRVPEETLNVLITALAEGEIHVPRVGHIPAAPQFRLIAAMNPFDAVGTARVGQAIYDRMCRIALGYQDRAGEERIVEQVTGAAGELTEDYEQEVARAAAYLGTGDQASPGRSVASIFMEPGNQAFNVTSGLLDVALNIYADPTVYASKGVGIVRH